MNNDRDASYPYIMMRAVGQSSTSSFSGQKTLGGLVFLSLVHDSVRCPFKPWTKTILAIK